jgi:hypothetical protein
MGKKSRLKRLRREGVSATDPLMWGTEEGVNALGVGQPPSASEVAAMTAAYQDSQVAALGSNGQRVWRAEVR